MMNWSLKLILITITAISFSTSANSTKSIEFCTNQDQQNRLTKWINFLKTKEDKILAENSCYTILSNESRIDLYSKFLSSKIQPLQINDITSSQKKCQFEIEKTIFQINDLQNFNIGKINSINLSQLKENSKQTISLQGLSDQPIEFLVGTEILVITCSIKNNYSHFAIKSINKQLGIHTNFNLSKGQSKEIGRLTQNNNSQRMNINNKIRFNKNNKSTIVVLKIKY